MYLFILESIGTSELILIGLVALIFLGPRKIPELAKTFGKIMNEFRRSTNEFKETWEREVASEVNLFKEEPESPPPTSTPQTFPKEINKPEVQTSENVIKPSAQVALPEIKEVSQENFIETPPKISQIPEKTETANTLNEKQNWL